MAAFPPLKTGAVMQYPARRSTSFSTRVLRFLDGAEQRYRQSASGLKRWVIALALLDEREMAALRDFYRSNQGQTGSFAFTDPWDNATYNDCSLELADFIEDFIEIGNGSAILVVRENRS